MSYLQLTYLHLGTVLPAFLIGGVIFLRQKGTPIHKAIGKLYMVFMLITAIITLFMSAEVGPTFLNHFGFIHLFSFLVLYSVPAAYIAAKNGRIATHKANMVGVYLGGVLIAGGFAFMPGRLLHTWLLK
ncbi:MAG: DUF2306 domain-containing protein [Pseudomonadota bacterium]